MVSTKVLVNKVRVVEMEGKESFVALDLVQLKAVRSKITNRDYLGTVKASITTNLSPELAKTMIGSELPGAIKERPIVLKKGEKFKKWTNPRTKEEVEITIERYWDAQAEA